MNFHKKSFEQAAVSPGMGVFSAPSFRFSNNSQSIVTYVSPSVEIVLGYKPNQIVGRYYTEFLDAASPQNKDVQDWAERRFNGDGQHEHIRMVHDRNRNIRVLRIVTYGETDENGRVIANHGVAHDITDLYVAQQESRNRLEYLNELSSRLTEREGYVVERVLDGRLNKSIAKELHISERAVERIRARVIKKFEAENTAQLISLVTEKRVLSKLVWLKQ